MAFRYFQQMGERTQRQFVTRLTALGEDALDYAFHLSFKANKNKGEQGVWTHRTFNLGDSFGCAVYVDGVLEHRSIRYIHSSPKSQTPDRTTGEYGRQALDDYFNSIHPLAGTGDAILIVASAMYYTKFLEEGSYGNMPGGGRPRIRVISGARDYIDRNWWAYVYDIYRRWQLPKPKARVIKGVLTELQNTFYNG